MCRHKKYVVEHIIDEPCNIFKCLLYSVSFLKDQEPYCIDPPSHVGQKSHLNVSSHSEATISDSNIKENPYVGKTLLSRKSHLKLSNHSKLRISKIESTKNITTEKPLLKITGINQSKLFENSDNTKSLYIGKPLGSLIPPTEKKMVMKYDIREGKQFVELNAPNQSHQTQDNDTNTKSFSTATPLVDLTVSKKRKLIDFNNSIKRLNKSKPLKSLINPYQFTLKKSKSNSESQDNDDISVSLIGASDQTAFVKDSNCTKSLSDGNPIIDLTEKKFTQQIEIYDATKGLLASTVVSKPAKLVKNNTPNTTNICTTIHLCHTTDNSTQILSGGKPTYSLIPSNQKKTELIKRIDYIKNQYSSKSNLIRSREQARSALGLDESNIGGHSLTKKILQLENAMEETLNTQNELFPTKPLFPTHLNHDQQKDVKLVSCRKPLNLSKSKSNAVKCIDGAPYSITEKLLKLQSATKETLNTQNDLFPTTPSLIKSNQSNFFKNKNDTKSLDSSDEPLMSLVASNQEKNVNDDNSKKDLGCQKTPTFFMPIEMAKEFISGEKPFVLVPVSTKSSTKAFSNREDPFSNREVPFSSIQHLKPQVPIKKDNKPYMCEFCPAMFKRPSALMIHRRIHTGEKPFQCQLCPSAFPSKITLKYHMNVHNGERERPLCDLCGKAFSSNKAINVHRKIHTGERSHKCRFCPAAFVQYTALTAHLRVHTKDNPFKCKLCSASFKSSAQLKFHSRIHNSETNKV